MTDAHFFNLLFMCSKTYGQVVDDLLLMTQTLHARDQELADLKSSPDQNLNSPSPTGKPLDWHTGRDRQLRWDAGAGLAASAQWPNRAVTKQGAPSWAEQSCDSPAGSGGTPDNNAMGLFWVPEGRQGLLPGMSSPEAAETVWSTQYGHAALSRHIDAVPVDADSSPETGSCGWPYAAGSKHDSPESGDDDSSAGSGSEDGEDGEAGARPRGPLSKEPFPATRLFRMDPQLPAGRARVVSLAAQHGYDARASGASLWAEAEPAYLSASWQDAAAGGADSLFSSSCDSAGGGTAASSYDSTFCLEAGLGGLAPLMDGTGGSEAALPPSHRHSGGHAPLASTEAAALPLGRRRTGSHVPGSSSPGLTIVGSGGVMEDAATCCLPGARGRIPTLRLEEDAAPSRTRSGPAGEKPTTAVQPRRVESAGHARPRMG